MNAKWIRSGLLSVGLAGAMIGGGAMVAHAQTSDSSSSSSSTDGSSSASTGNGSSSTTTPAQGTAPSGAAQPGNCPNM
jgi:hypothetical protein